MKPIYDSGGSDRRTTNELEQISNDRSFAIRESLVVVGTLSRDDRADAMPVKS